MHPGRIGTGDKKVAAEKKAQYPTAMTATRSPVWRGFLKENNVGVGGGQRIAYRPLLRIPGPNLAQGKVDVVGHHPESETVDLARVGSPVTAATSTAANTSTAAAAAACIVQRLESLRVDRALRFEMSHPRGAVGFGGRAKQQRANFKGVAPPRDGNQRDEANGVVRNRVQRHLEDKGRQSGGPNGIL